MSIIKLNIIFLLLVKVNISNGIIVMIQSTIRHSDRYPADLRAGKLYYPNDPNGNLSFWPDGPMELTSVSKIR